SWQQTACSCCAPGPSARRTGRYSTRSARAARCWQRPWARFPKSPAMPPCIAVPRRQTSAPRSPPSVTGTSSLCGLRIRGHAPECSAAASPGRRTSVSSRRCSMVEPLLTVVICSHNRPEDLERCLRGLAALEDDVAGIVVDSASNPPLRATVDGFSASVRRLTYHHVSQPGLSLARNRGLELARTELVAFLDDDTVPERAWARNLVGPFADPKVVCVGG